MVNVSKKYLDEKLKAEIWNRFVKEISLVKSEKQAEQFLKKLFTSSEIIMLEKRLATMILIDKGLKYRDISNLIDVAPATIAFIKSGFKKKSVKTRKNSSTLKFKTSPKFKRRKFPAYKGRGRWDFMTNPL